MPQTMTTDLETVRTKVLAAAIKGGRDADVGRIELVGDGHERLVHVSLANRVVVYRVSVTEVTRS